MAIHIMLMLPKLSKGLSLIAHGGPNIAELLEKAATEYEINPVSISTSAMRIAGEKFDVSFSDCMPNISRIEKGDKIITVAHGHTGHYTVD